VDIRNEWGVGTAFILTVPISTAVADLLQVRVGTQILSIPLRRIVETGRMREA
jgi:chemotaxis protein histidine kinase CheA